MTWCSILACGCKHPQPYLSRLYVFVLSSPLARLRRLVVSHSPLVSRPVSLAPGVSSGFACPRRLVWSCLFPASRLVWSRSSPASCLISRWCRLLLVAVYPTPDTIAIIVGWMRMSDDGDFIWARRDVCPLLESSAQYACVPPAKAYLERSGIV